MSIKLVYLGEDGQRSTSTIRKLAAGLLVAGCRGPDTTEVSICAKNEGWPTHKVCNQASVSVASVSI